jgi:hypothetical protein
MFKQRNEMMNDDTPVGYSENFAGGLTYQPAM